jgi:hypothetical protein
MSLYCGGSQAIYFPEPTHIAIKYDPPEYQYPGGTRPGDGAQQEDVLEIWYIGIMPSGERIDIPGMSPAQQSSFDPSNAGDYFYTVTNARIRRGKTGTPSAPATFNGLGSTNSQANTVWSDPISYTTAVGGGEPIYVSMEVEGWFNWFMPPWYDTMQGYVVNEDDSIGDLLFELPNGCYYENNLVCSNIVCGDTHEPWAPPSYFIPLICSEGFIAPDGTFLSAFDNWTLSRPNSNPPRGDFQVYDNAIYIPGPDGTERGVSTFDNIYVGEDCNVDLAIKNIVYPTELDEYGFELRLVPGNLPFGATGHAMWRVAFGRGGSGTYTKWTRAVTQDYAAPTGGDGGLTTTYTSTTELYIRLKRKGWNDFDLLYKLSEGAAWTPYQSNLNLDNYTLWQDLGMFVEIGRGSTLESTTGECDLDYLNIDGDVTGCGTAGYTDAIGGNALIQDWPVIEIAASGWQQNYNNWLNKPLPGLVCGGYQSDNERADLNWPKLSVSASGRWILTDINIPVIDCYGTEGEINSGMNMELQLECSGTGFQIFTAIRVRLSGQAHSFLQGEPQDIADSFKPYFILEENPNLVDLANELFIGM